MSKADCDRSDRLVAGAAGLTDAEKAFFEEHIENCQSCYIKYSHLLADMWLEEFPELGPDKCVVLWHF